MRNIPDMSDRPMDRKRILIAGGRLQGVEVAYLAAEAGYETMLVDRDRMAPARGLVSEFRQVDIDDEDAMLPLVAAADIVLPALEDLGALQSLERYGKRTRTPVIYDSWCFELSHSKTASNHLFEELGLAVPEPYPRCGLPVIVKPDDDSGSHGVHRADSAARLDALLASTSTGTVIQRFVEGRSYSMEIIGDGRRRWALPITEVCTARDYDCMRIVAPAEIPADARRRFQEIGSMLGEALGIRGIFDIEVIVEDGIPYVLEIDARFPSQTPISIYHATGINMVACLTDIAEGTFSQPTYGRNRACLYQQVEADDTGVHLIGERPLSRCGPLRRMRDFFGADEALTDYTPEARKWRAIVIVTGSDHAEARDRFERCLSDMNRTMQSRNQRERWIDVTTH